jgi:hypothetical protein
MVAVCDKLARQHADADRRGELPREVDEPVTAAHTGFCVTE